MSETRQGILLMIFAMAFFAIGDALIKANGNLISPAQIIFFVGLGGLIIFALIQVARREPIWGNDFWIKPVLLRHFGEMLGTVCVVTAFTLTPLSTTSAILQANPLIVTMAGALFMGERVGWRRWLAIICGFICVLIIIRPGSEDFDSYLLLAVAGTIGLSMRDIGSRLVPKAISNMQLSIYAYFLLTVLGFAMILIDGSSIIPSAGSHLKLAFLIIAATVGYFLITKATRMGELSLVMPFRYSRLLFALFLGAVFFDERPDALTLIGSAGIILSGLFLMWRERKV